MNLRTGPTSIWEAIREPLRIAAILIVTMALASVLIVALKSLGHPRSIHDQVRLWCVVFGVFVLSTLVQGMFGRRDRAIAVGLLGGLVTAVVWLWGEVVVAILTGTYGVMVVPPIS
jgi:hypothetical protein